MKSRCEHVTKSVTNVVLYIPIDFSIEFWNCTFPQALKFFREFSGPLRHELSNGTNPEA